MSTGRKTPEGDVQNEKKTEEGKEAEERDTPETKVATFQRDCSPSSESSDSPLIGEESSVPTVSLMVENNEKLMTQMERKISEPKDHVEASEVLVTHAIIELQELNSAQNSTSDEGEIPSENFFVEEWQAFKSEMKTKLSDKEKVSTVLNFNNLCAEFTYSPTNENHWKNQKKKAPNETCSPLFYTVLIGIIVTLIPNSLIVLDIKAAYEYLLGNWYLKRGDDPEPLNSICQDAGNGNRECFETDMIWGIMTLILLFLPGIFWSLGIFIQFATHLREKDPDTYDRKRCLFFFFVPLAALTMVTFPLQLVAVSLVSCFNNQDQWMLLTSKIGIAEGLFNAHFQYLLQLFIFFVRADRHPSFFQYAAACGSLVFLVWSRIESLLVDRGGHKISPGRKVWWACRFGPMFLFNSAFKVGSISLICAMLRYNAIWFYSIVVIVWLLLQFLFNEQYLPRKYYYLFIGAAMHAVSIAHIPEEVKMIHAKANSNKNTMWATRLTDFQMKANMWFQNIIWFVLNSVIIITLTVVAELKTDAEFPTFWPFFPETVSFKDNKVFGGLKIIAPVILIAGLISLILLWNMDFKRTDRKEINRGIKSAIAIKTKDAVDNAKRSSVTSCEDFKTGEFAGWRHQVSDCPACISEEDEPGPTWHRYAHDGNVAEVSKTVNMLSRPHT